MGDAELPNSHEHRVNEFNVSNSQTHRFVQIQYMAISHILLLSLQWLVLHWKPSFIFESQVRLFKPFPLIYRHTIPIEKCALPVADLAYFENSFAWRVNYTNSVVRPQFGVLTMESEKDIRY